MLEVKLWYNITMPKKTTTKKLSSVAKVFKDTVLIREYTKEVHGKDFEKLAQSFAEKKNLSVVVS